MVNFTGTYILVEPNDDAIHSVVCIHAHIMPLARVVGLRMDAMALALMPAQVFEESLGVKKENVRLIVGNHAIDDMILASTFSSQAEAETFFHVLESEGEQSLELAKRYWTSLESTQKLRDAMKETEMEWRLLLNHLPPEYVALSAYRSGSFTRKGLTLPDDSAKIVMDRLKLLWNVTAEEHERFVAPDLKDPERWLVHRCRDGSSTHNMCVTAVDMAEIVHLFW